MSAIINGIPDVLYKGATSSNTPDNIGATTANITRPNKAIQITNIPPP